MSLFGPPNIEKMLTKRDVEGLIKALDYKKDQNVCKEAADALCKIGTPAADSLIVALKGNNKDLRMAAADVLTKIGWQPGRDENGAYYWMASGELDRCAELGAMAVGALGVALRDGDRDAQRRAAIALGNIADVRAVPFLSSAFNTYCKMDDMTSIAEAVVVALGKVGDARAIESLIDALNYKNTCIAAADSLVKIGKPAIQPLFNTFVFFRGQISEGPYKSNRPAVEILGKIGDPCAVELLITALNSEESLSLGKSAARALGNIGDSRAVGPLIAKLKDGDYEMRMEAAIALGKIGDRRAIDPLIALLNSRQKQVVVEEVVYMAAVDALRKIGDTQAAVPLITVLQDNVSTLLKEHIAHLSKMLEGKPGEKESLLFIRQVLTEDLLTFAVDQIMQKMPEAASFKAIEKHKALHSSKTFGEWFIAISICQGLRPEEIKETLDQKYMELLNELAAPALNTPEGKNIVHWVYGFRLDQAAVRLSLIPNPKGTYKGTVILAQDLLTPQERQETELLGTMESKNTCAFCGKKLTEDGDGATAFSVSNMLEFADRMLARKFICPSCSSIFCLECGNKKGKSLGTGSTHCPKCDTKVL